ncbi:MAG: hypothetical protein GX220_01425 [Treponema sp.]|nr:hypothetical protein [Treponema sp.]
MLKSFFSGMGKFFLLVALCALFALVIVWPLWKWATSSPTSYSVVLLSVLAFTVVLSVIKKIFAQIKSSKKSNS